MTAQDPTAPPDPFSLCGTTIEGKYRVASVVGDGGFGVVYRGVHKGFGELIAIKCLKMPLELDEQHKEALLEQLRDEGRILHRLSKVTSGIVQALDVGAFTTASGAWVPFLVLEWLEGETLGEHLANRLARGEKPYSLADGIRLLEPAARALAVAHQQKVAHRDVKPPNLFVTDVGGVRTVKVLDFGIAKVLTETTAQLEATKQGPSAFTPRYGAPEQFNKQRGASGPWTDVFALALILVEVVTGKKALEGDDPTQLYIASADTLHRPTLRARGVSDAPDAVEKVLARALAVDPKERFSEAGTFWDALVEAAGLPATRSSAPQIQAPSAEPTTAKAAREPSDAEGIRVRGPSSPTPRDHSSLGATMPVESLVSAQPAVVVENKNATPRGSSSSKRKIGDAMDETPIHARLPPASPTSRPTELTLIPKKAAPAKKKPRALWPYVVMLLAIGAGAVWFTMQAGFEDPKAARGPRPGASGTSAATRGKTKPGPGHAATGATPSSDALLPPSPSSSASAAASASALPASPPGDMVEIAPAGKVKERFFLDKFEVSTKAYLECVTAHQCGAADKVTGMFDEEKAEADGGAPEAAATQDYLTEWSSRCNAHGGPDNHPINCVDLREAQTFCGWKEKRLPSEAEWELAARGTENRAFPWGASPPNECGDACFDKNGACLRRAAGGGVSTCVAGGRPADKTPEGVFDLGGNVSEWTREGVVRGGNFADPADLLKSTTRHEVAPSLAHAKLGFRCAL